MKHFIIVIFTFCSLPFTVNAQSADVFAQVTDIEYIRNVPMYSITTEDGTVTKAFISDGIALTQGQWGDFTVEYAPSSLSSSYNYINKFTLMPEFDQKVGYLYNSALDKSSFGDAAVLVLIDGDMKTLHFKRVSINDQTYYNIYENSDMANAVADIIKNYRGCVSYTTDSEGYITDLNYITEAKKTYTSVVYNNGFDNL